MIQMATAGDDTKTKPSDRKSKGIVKEARERIQQAWEFDRDNRREAATDMAFTAGDQWPQQVRQERELEGRPMLTLNRLPQFVRQVTNDIRQADLAIKTSPVDGNSDPKLSDIYNGIIRQIQYQSSAVHVYANTAEHQVICGIGWFRIATEYTDDTTFEQEIRIRQIANPMSVFVDPAAVEIDRSDAKWIAVTSELPIESFKADHPEASTEGIDTQTDHQSALHWSTTETIRVAEYWVKEPVKKTLVETPDGQAIDITDMQPQLRRMMGVDKMRQRVVNTHKVKMYLVSGAEVLSGPHDWAGKYIPIIPIIGTEIALEKATYRFGMVRFARDAQQLYNYYRTAAAESIALAPKAPFLVTPKMISAHLGEWQTANKRNRPFLPYTPDPEAPGLKPMREHPPEMPAALMQEAQLASEDLKSTTGIHDASLGAKSNETSGRAIFARQREGDVANYHFSDNLERALQYAGRILIDLIPKVYDSQRIIRIMGDDDSEDFVPINQVVYGVDGVPQMVNDLSTARFDVRVAIGPSYSTKRMETAASLVEFMKALPNAAPLIADLVAKSLDFPGAEEVAKRLKNTIPPNILADPDDPETQPPPPPDPMQDPTIRADVELKQAQAEKAKAEAYKAQIEVAQMEQAGIQPQFMEPQEIEPQHPYQNEMHEAEARKAMAGASQAEHQAELTRLQTMHFQPPVPPQEEGEAESNEYPPA